MSKKLIEDLQRQYDAGNYSTPMQASHLLETIEHFKRTGIKESSGSKQKPRPITLTELLSKDYPPYEWQIDELIPRYGITFISGKPSSYKTWLTLDMALSIASGSNYLGKFPPTKGKILIIDEESGERILSKRIKALSGDKNLPIELKTLQGFKVEADTDDLIDYCLDKQIAVVIIDSLIRIHGKDENSSTEMNKVYDQLKKFKKNNLTVIITHHQRKGQAGGHGNGDDLRGSGDILAACDCHLSVSSNKELKIIKISQTKLRENEERPNFIVKYIAENDKLQFNYDSDEKTAPVSKVKTAEYAVLEYLAEKGESKRQDLINDLKLKSLGETTIENAIKNLTNDGLIKSRSGTGKSLFYSLTQSQQ